MPKSPTPEQQLEAVRDQVRAEIREAREVLKDLHGEIKEARRLVPLLAAELFEAEVRKHVAELGVATKKAMDASVTRVTAKFDRLAALLMGEDRSQQREPSIPEMVEALTQPERTEAPNCGVINPRQSATCTDPRPHLGDHHDAFGHVWPQRATDKPLFTEGRR